MLKVHEWLAENVRKDTQVGVDPKKIDSVEYEMISKYLGLYLYFLKITLTVVNLLANLNKGLN